MLFGGPDSQPVHMVTCPGLWMGFTATAQALLSLNSAPANSKEKRDVHARLGSSIHSFVDKSSEAMKNFKKSPNVPAMLSSDTTEQFGN